MGTLYVWSFLFVIQTATALNEIAVGGACRQTSTLALGVCTYADLCKTARQDYNDGVALTYCSEKLHNGVPLVCCRDGPDREAVQVNRKRVSERVCEMYSRDTVESVGYIGLTTDPEQMTLSAPKCDYTGVELVVGGEDAIQGEFPHMAAIGWLNNEGGYGFHCGGSLISSRFVMTAGHCTYKTGAVPRTPSIVRLGDQNLDPSIRDHAYPVDIRIKKIYKHPDYRSPSKYNDIALLELEEAVSFTTDVRPACLWTKSTLDGIDKVLATGWGVVNPSTKAMASNLQKVSLSLFNNRHCNELKRDDNKRNWERGVLPTQVCAGELRGGKDTCQGDSGSPIQIVSKENRCIFHVIGLTSFGGECAAPGKPGIYTRVSEYLDWIESLVWPNFNMK